MDKGWSEKNKQMQSLLNKKDTFKEAIDVLLSLEYKDLKRKFDGSFSEKLKSSYYACGGYARGNDGANAAKA